MGDYAVELSLDDEGEAAVVAQWRALQDAGLPSQADHRTMRNAPHVCLVVTPDPGPDLRRRALDGIGPLVPQPLAVRGLLVLGEGPRVTVAHLVEPTPELAAATQALRQRTPALRHPVWTPHLTLARRVPRRLLPELLGALDGAPTPRRLVATRLRWWDPARGLVEDLVDGPPAH